MEDMEVNSDSDFWYGRRVFLTGHTGFKGGWLALWLESMGAEVTGYALDPPTDPNLFETIGIGHKITHIVGDVRDYHAMRCAINSARPEIVFHFAAQPLVRRSYTDPEETFSTNVMGALNLFEAVRSTNSVRAVVNVTSDKCYENHEWVWPYRESDSLGGHDPYAASKACVEILTNSYRDSFFSGNVSIATVRAGNVIGGGDWASDRLIPDLVRGFSSDEKVYIRNPNAVRPWQHVLDALSGYLLLAQRLLANDGHRYAQSWNFGPDYDSEATVEEIVRRVAKLWGGQGQFEISSNSGEPHETTILRLDVTKARAMLGWSPRLSLNDALEMTIHWYRAYANGEENLLGLMEAQINQYKEQSS